MSESSLHTTRLHEWIDRIQAGDREGHDELIRATCGRLERLARKMLRGYTSLDGQVQTDDVLQNALLRLLRALEKVRPNSVRDFFGLAAEQMRRELLDLARYHASQRRRGTRSVSQLQDKSDSPNLDPPAPSDDELERWERFHEEVEKLPAELREVISLRFYHGWTQAEIGRVLCVDERTVRRRWEAALATVARNVNADDLVVP